MIDNLKIIEIVGVCIWLFSAIMASNNNILTWPAGIIGNIVFFVLFYKTGLYANMVLQLFFATLELYGWISWSKSSSHIKKIKNKLLIFWVITFIIIATNIFLFLSPKNIDYSLVSYLDVLTTVLNIGGSIFFLKRYIQSWYIWLLVDVLAICMFYQQGLYWMMILYVILIGNAFFGIYKWSNQYKNQIA